MMRQFILSTLVLLSLMTMAQTKTWVGGNNQNWNVAGNWNPVGIPTNTDHVFITGNTLVVAANAEARAITVDQTGGGTTLRVQGGTLTVDTLNHQFTDNSNSNCVVEARTTGAIVVNTLYYMYQDAANTRSNRNLQLQVEDNGVVTIARMLVDYDGTGNNRDEIYMENDGILNITDLVIDISGDNTGFEIEIDDDAVWNVTDSIIGSITSTAGNGTNADISFNFDEQADVNVGGPIIIYQNGGDDILFYTANTADVDVSGDVRVYSTTGDDVYFSNAGDATIDFGGVFHYQSSGNDDFGLIQNSTGNFTIADSIRTDMLVSGATNPIVYFDVYDANLNSGVIDAQITGVAGQTDYDFEINGGNVNTGDFTVNLPSGDDITIQVLSGELNASDFNVSFAGNDDVFLVMNAGNISCNNLSFSMTGGDDLTFRTNGTNVAQTEDTLIVNGDFSLSMNGGDNIDVDIYYNTLMTVTGNVNLTSVSDDDDIIDWQQYNSSVSCTDFKLSESGATHQPNNVNTIVDIEGSSVLTVSEDMALHFQNSRQGYLRLGNDGNANFPDGAALDIGDSLSVTIGQFVLDTYIELDANQTDKRLKASNVFIVDSAYSGDQCRFIVDAANDSVVVTDDFVYQGIGTENGNDDFFFDINGGFVNIQNDMHLRATDLNQVTVTVDIGTLVVGDSVVINSDCTGNTEFYTRSGGVSTIGATVDVDFGATNSGDFLLYAGNDGASRGRVVIGEDLLVDGPAAGDDIYLAAYFNSYLEVAGDLTITKDLGTNESETRIRIEDGTSDTLLIGGSLNYVGTNGTAGTADDFYIDHNLGWFEVGGNIDINLDGDDIDFEINAGVGTFLVDSNVTLVGTDGLIWEFNCDSSRIGGDFSYSITGDGAATEDITINLDAGDQVIAGDFTVQGTSMDYMNMDVEGINWTIGDDFKIEMLSTSDDFDMNFDGTTVTIGDSLILTWDEDDRCEFYINNGSRFNIGGSYVATFTGDADFLHRIGQTAKSDMYVTGDFIHTSDNSSDDYSLTLLNTARLSVGGKMELSQDCDGAGDRINIYMNTTGPDTLDIGWDFIVTGTNGDNNTDDDFSLDKNTGLLSVGGDWVISWAGDDILIDDDGGEIEVDSTVSLTNTGDAISWSILNDSTRVSGDMSLTMTSGTDATSEDLLYDLDAGLHVVGGDLLVSATDIANLFFDIDDVTWTINGELNINSTSAVEDQNVDVDNTAWTVGDSIIYTVSSTAGAGYFAIDNNANTTVGKSVVLTNTGSRAFTARLGTNDANRGRLTIGEDYIITQTGGTGLVLNFQQFYGSYLNVTQDLAITHQMAGAGTSRFNWDMDDLVDTLIVGRDYSMSHSGGANASDDDLILDINAAEIEIGRDWIVSMTDGDDVSFNNYGATVKVGRNWDIDYSDAGTMRWSLYTGFDSLRVGGDMTVRAKNCDGDFTMDVESGDVTIAGEVYWHVTNNGGVDVNWDQEGGTTIIGQDFHVIGDSIDDIHLYLDNGSAFYVADSIIIDMDSTGSHLVYLEDGTGTGSEITASNIYVNRANGGDVRFLLEGDSKIEVTNDIYFETESTTGDGIEIELTSSTDTLIVGQDVKMHINDGNEGGDADIEFDVIGGRVSIGRDLDIYNRNGSSNTIDFNGASDIDIGRYLYSYNYAGDGTYWDITDANVDIVDDVVILDSGYTSTGTDLGMPNIDGTSDVNLGEDFIILWNSEVRRVYFTVDDESVLQIKDSLYLDLDLLSDNFYFRVGVNGSSGVGPALIVDSNFVVEADATSDDVEIYVDNDGRISVGRNLEVYNIGDADEDRIQVYTRNANDTITIGNDLILHVPSGTGDEEEDVNVDFDGGYVSVGNDVDIDVNGGGDALWRSDATEVVIGRDLIMIDTNARDLDVDVTSSGSLSIGRDFRTLHYHSQRYGSGDANMYMDITADEVNVGEDFYAYGNQINNWYTRVNNDARFIIGDSAHYDIDEMTADALVQINQSGSGAFMDVGTYFVVDHTAAGDDFYVQLNNDARLDVGQDFVLTSDSDTDDFMRFQCQNANDTVNIGDDFLMTVTGSSNAEDDIRLELNAAARFNVVDDIELIASNGGDNYFLSTGSDVDVGGHVYLKSTSNTQPLYLDINGGTFDVVDSVLLWQLENNDGGDRVEFEHNDGTTNIGGMLSIIGHENGVVNFDVDAGDVTVDRDITIDQLGSSANLNIDIEGATINANEDVRVRVNGGNEFNWYMDNGGQLLITDSLTLDLDSINANSNERILLNNDGVAEGTRLDVGTSFYIDHERYYDDMEVRVANNAYLGVGTNFEADWTADGGDLLTIRTVTADDSVVVGGNVDMVMDQGSVVLSGGIQGDDDFRLDIDGGVFTVGGYVYQEINGGSHARIDMEDGLFTVGGTLIQQVDNAHTAEFFVADGIVNVAGDFKMLSTNDFANDDVTIQIFGGDLTFAEDVYIYTDQVNGVAGDIRGDAQITIADSLYMDEDGSSNGGNFYFNLNTPTGQGPTFNVGSFLVMDHEEDGSDMYFQLNNNGRLNVDSSIVMNHYANGGDYLGLFLANSSGEDSLVVGKNIEMNLFSQTGSDDGDDIRFEPRYGYSAIAGDLLVDVNDGADFEFDLYAGTHTIGGIWDVDVDDADEIDVNIDGGTLTVTGDVTFDAVNSGAFNYVINAGDQVYGEDVVVTYNSPNDRIYWRQDNGADVSIADTLIINYVQSDGDQAQLYLEEDGNTGSSLTVGSSFVYTHGAGASDFVLRLEGDANMEVGNDIIVDQTVDGVDGDYFRIELDELNGNDTLIVGGDLLMTVTGGNSAYTDNGDTDDNRTNSDGAELEIRGGYTHVTGDIIQTVVAGEYTYIDVEGGELEVDGEVLLSGTTDASTIGIDQAGGVMTFDSTVYLICGTCDEVYIQAQGGGATFNDRVDIYANGNSTGSDARLYVGGTALVTFNDTVYVKAKDAGEAELQSDGANIVVFNAPVYIFDTNATDLEIDFNGAQMQLNDDLFLWIYDSDEFNLTLNSGEMSIGEDLYIDVINPGASSEFFFNAGGGLAVSDSVIITVSDVNNRNMAFNFDTDDNSSGSYFTCSNWQMDHDASMGDVYFTMEGDADFKVSNDLVFNMNASGGDLLQFNLEEAGSATDGGVSDTIYVGGDFIINHTGDSNGGGDLNFYIDEGTVQVEGDMIITLNGSADGQSLNWDVRNTGSWIVGDTMKIDMDDWGDLLLDQEGGSSISIGTFIADVEEPVRDVNLDIQGGSFNVIGDFDIDHAATTNDHLEIDFADSVQVSIGGDMNLRYTNATSNGDSEMRVYVRDTANVTVAGNVFFDLEDGERAEYYIYNDGTLNVNKSLTLETNADEVSYFRLGTDGLNGYLNVDSNLVVQYQAGGSFTVQADNSSIVDVDSNIITNATAQATVYFDFNNNAELRLGDSLDRGANLFGHLNFESDAIFTYDGARNQLMMEEGGGGSDALTYGIVRIDNSSGNIPGVTMQTATDITGLYMDQGYLGLHDQTLTITDGTTGRTSQTAGGVISESSSDLLRIQVSTNTGSHIYPFATDNGDLLPYDFTLNSGDAGDVDIYTYETGSDNLPLPASVTVFSDSVGSDNSLFAMDRFWVIEPSGGTYNVDVQMPYSDAEFAAPNTITESRLMAQRWNATDSKWDGVTGGADTGNNWVTVSGVSAFSPWVLVDGNVPLPIELLDFNAQYDDAGEVIVTWSTASELNNALFVIERSADGVYFHEVGEVDGAGTSNSVLHYEFIDVAPLFGTSYYRLRQIDYDGTNETSDILAVEINDEALHTIAVYPNPVVAGESELHVVFGSIGVDLDVTLFNVLQRDLTSVAFDRVEGNEMIFNTEALSPGVYIVRVTIDGEFIDKKVVIE